MIRVLRLIEQDVLVRINATGDQRGCHLSGGLAQACRVLKYGQRMLIHDAINAFIVFLQRCPVADCPQIVPQRQIASWLNARENAGFMR